MLSNQLSSQVTALWEFDYFPLTFSVTYMSLFIFTILCDYLPPANELLSLKLETSTGADSALVQVSAELYSVISAHRAAVWGRGPSETPFVSPEIKG